MKNKHLLQTTLKIGVRHTVNPEVLGILIMHVDNYFDQQGRIVEFHTRDVDFYGNGFSQNQILDFKKTAKSIMDSNNPDAWAHFGNKTINEI